MTRLTDAQASRVAVAAQGLAAPRPAGTVTRAHLRRLMGRIQVLQLDSVSVAVRAHYAPVFSRLGPYDRDVLDAAPWSGGGRVPRLLVEYWAHEAALMSVQDWPLLRWRMREYVHGRWGVEIVKGNPHLVDDVVAAVADLGPSTAGQIETYLDSGARRGKGTWWNRSDTKWVAEALFAAGVLTTAHRVGFARHYDLVERVLPADVLARQVEDTEAVRELVLRAATALGVATEPTSATTSGCGPSRPSPRWPPWSPRVNWNRCRWRAGPPRPTCGPDRACRGSAAVPRCCARSTR